MATKITHNLTEIVDSLVRVRQALDHVRRAATTAVVIQVLSWTWQGYRAKARGGADRWGITWAPIQRATIAGRLRRLSSYRRLPRDQKSAAIDAAMARHEIGVDTGRLINSLQPGVEVTETTTGAFVGSTIAYADHFTEDRPILPDNLTDDDLTSLTALVESAYRRYGGIFS